MISDAAARAAALDPRRSFIVQAPAGSGKTELLTQRYLRLLTTVEFPEQILAITFTRKAAAEMRARILAALSRDQAQRWNLAEHPSRLRIQTIDALNASLARRLPVLAATGSALEPTSDPYPLYEAAGRRLIERLGDGSSAAAELEVLIMHLGNRVDRLIDLLSALLAKRDQWLHPVVEARASEDLRSILEDTLDRLVRRHLELVRDALGPSRLSDIFELLQYSAGNLLVNPATAAMRRAGLSACLDRATPPEAESGCLDVWRAIATMLFKKDGELYSTVNVGHGFPTTNREMKARLLALLRGLSADSQLCAQLLELRTLPDPFYSDEQWAILSALLELLPAAVAELQLVFQAEAKADYVEVALRALRALGTADSPTDLALAFDYRLQHILVDEFQDTSFGQLDLLERLTAGWSPGDGRTLFCVGDPMQSIYRFRQAEVGLFIELQRRGLDHLPLEPLRLEANFRATPPLVEWVNRVFPAVLASRNDAEQGAVKYSPSTAARTDEVGGVQMHALIDADDDAEAQRIVSLIAEDLEENREGRIAVLVTARAHVDAIARHLTAARIEFQAVEIERLRDRPVVQDLIALTRALVHLADRTAWLAVLRAPWCGLTLSDLHVLAGETDGVIADAIAAALQSGSELSDDGRARLTRAREVLESALTERGRWPLRLWVERAWNALGGPATLARVADLDDAESFFQRLEEIETVADLEDVARLESQLDRLFAGSRASGAPRVELMTIHAAKGLEFETVILPGLERQVRGDDRELLRWTRIAGEGGGIVLAPIKAEGSEADALYRWLELLERQRGLRERARLLYVAATRAKRRLHLLGTLKTTTRAGETALSEPRRGSMLRMLWPEVAAAFDSASPESESTPHVREAPLQRLRRLPLDWRSPEPTAESSPESAGLIETSPDELIFDWVSETSRHVGTLVHHELDRLSRPGATAFAPTQSLRSRYAVELAELGVPRERIGVATERVVEAIQRTLSERRGRWLLGLEGDVDEGESELALSGVIDGSVVAHVIDRVFVDASGTRWVVDFKTSTHEGGGLDEFLASEVTRYRGQLARYARLMRGFRPDKPVRAALYFPLLGVWQEVEV